MSAAAGSIGLNVGPPRLPAAPAQAASSGSSTPFQNIYQNLPAFENGNDSSSGGQAQTTAGTPQKKKSNDDNTAGAATAPVPTAIALPKAPITLALSPVLPGHAFPEQPLPAQSEPAQAASANPEATRASDANAGPAQATQPKTSTALTALVSNPASLAISASISNEQVQAASKTSTTKLTPAAGEREAKGSGSPQNTPPGSTTAVVLPSVTPINSILPDQNSPVGKSSQQPPQPQSSPSPAVPQGSESTIKAAAARTFGLRADNLAFSARLTNVAGALSPELEQLAASATRSSPEPEEAPRSTSSQPQTVDASQSARVSVPAKSVPLVIPDVKSAPVANERAVTPSSGNVSKPDSTPRSLVQPQNTRLEAPHDSRSSEVPDSSGWPRDASQTSDLRGTPADGPMWNGTVQHVDLPSTPAAPQAPPILRASVTAQLAEVRPLIAEAPKVSPSNEVLLHVGEAQSSAAVRVVERAGTINVAVHATDPDLRNSLRSNLSDLTAQLNAQGLKTEGVRTTSMQGASENRPDQGTHEQRSSGQQQSSHQGDRQGQRDRRGNGQWLEEFADQTSANAGNPGGKNS